MSLLRIKRRRTDKILTNQEVQRLISWLEKDLSKIPYLMPSASCVGLRKNELI